MNYSLMSAEELSKLKETLSAWFDALQDEEPEDPESPECLKWLNLISDIEDAMDEIDEMLADGVTPEEIEELLNGA